MGGATSQRRHGNFFQKPTMVFIITIVWQRNIEVLIWLRRKVNCALGDICFTNLNIFFSYCTFEILSSSPISETARPRRRFMNTRAMIKMKMRKKILAMNGVSSALMKFAVKSNSPINIANTWKILVLLKSWFWMFLCFVFLVVGCLFLSFVCCSPWWRRSRGFQRPGWWGGGLLSKIEIWIHTHNYKYKYKYLGGG